MVVRPLSNPTTRSSKRAKTHAAEHRRYVCLEGRVRTLAVSLLALLPTAAHASGGDVLSLLWLSLLLLVAVVCSVVFGKLNATGKGIVFGAYLVGAIVPFSLTSNLPYSENLLFINTLCIGGPLTTWLLAFALARKKYGQT